MDAINNDNVSAPPADSPQSVARRQVIKSDQNRADRTVAFQRLMGGAAPGPKAAPLKAPLTPDSTPEQLPVETALAGGEAGPPIEAEPPTDAYQPRPDFDDHPPLSQSAAKFLSQMVATDVGRSPEAAVLAHVVVSPEEKLARRRRDEAEESAWPASATDDALSGVLSAGNAVTLPQAAGSPAAGPGRLVTIPPEVQQFVDFAAVTRNAQGVVEFRLGLSHEVFAGLGIRLSAYGNRRVGIRVSTGGRKGVVDDADLQSLIETLKQRGIEIVETVVD